MRRKGKVTFEEKLSAVKNYLEGRKSQGQLAREHNVVVTAVQQWVSMYQSMGASGLITTSKNSSYSKELKYAAVEDYLSDSASQLHICKKYNIRSTTQLRKWIMKYNGHERIKSSCTGGNSIMTKGRTTTFEERIEIVKYCIKNNRDFNKTVEKYKVSYQQVYSWTNKYDKFGIDALVDRRGKPKAEGGLTELDKLKAQNKLLEAKNKRLEMENELLKKLEEIERRRF